MRLDKMHFLRLIITGIIASCAVVSPAAASLPSWRVEIDRMEVGDIRLETVSIAGQSWDPDEAGVNVRAEKIIQGEGESTFGPLEANCPGDLFIVSASLCAGGRWELGLAEAWPPLSGTLARIRQDGGQLTAHASGRLETVEWSADVVSDAESTRVDVTLPEQGVEVLGAFATKLPATAWFSTGQISGSAGFFARSGQPFTGEASFSLAGADFDSPGGIYAGLAVEAKIKIDYAPSSEVMFRVAGELAGGELLLQDFYRDFSQHGMTATAEAAIGDGMLEVSRFVLGDGDALRLAGQARVPFESDDGNAQVLLRELRMAFPLAYSRYLESVARVWGLDGLETAGSIVWRGDWSPGNARSGTLEFNQFSVDDAARGRFSVLGLNGSLATGQQAQLSWEEAAFEKLDLGSGSVRLELTQESVKLVEPLEIGIFGGAVSVEALDVTVPRTRDPDIQVRAAIRDIEMLQMSRALGWPEFAGTLSGHIPDVSYSGGVIEIGGALEFQVFDGQIVLSDLRVERPFGVLPSLAANIVADNLDLEDLTQTFEFGRIAGRIDGYVRNLRMLDWNPVQFDAWFGTPAGAGRNDISRQAVSHLTTIGGGSATATLSGPLLRLFNNFSYSRLGLGCRLQDNVCHIRGIEEQGEAVLILEGAGLPNISIQAYNRSVDWPRLVAQLVAVSGADEVRIEN